MYVGLSGGIGAGKSTVANMFAGLGAIVIDADQVAREVVVPGSPALREVVEVFGEAILTPAGDLNRSELAKLVFADREKLHRLEAIIHPAVVARVSSVRSKAPLGSVVIYDTPLLAEKDLAKDFELVIMVTAPLTQRIDRLLARGLTLSDIENRIANQVADEDRVAIADIHIENTGTLDELAQQVEQVWQRITS
jgi:dephospho-CoA kinase